MPGGRTAWNLVRGRLSDAFAAMRDRTLASPRAKSSSAPRASGKGSARTGALASAPADASTGSVLGNEAGDSEGTSTPAASAGEIVGVWPPNEVDAVVDSSSSKSLASIWHIAGEDVGLVVAALELSPGCPHSSASGPASSWFAVCTWVMSSPIWSVRCCHPCKRAAQLTHD